MPDYSILGEPERQNSINKHLPKRHTMSFSPIDLKSLEDKKGVDMIYDATKQLSGSLVQGKDSGLSLPDVLNLYDKNEFYQSYRQGKEAGEDFYETGINYLFITKPNLAFTQNIPKFQGKHGNDPAVYNTINSSFAYYIAQNYPKILNSLTQTSNTPNFIPLLFNAFKSISLDEPNLETQQLYETYSGYNQTLGGTLSKSEASGNVSINFVEYQMPEVTFLHKLWVEYIDKVKKGYFKPLGDTIGNKEIDYACAIYYFNLLPDGETLSFWSRYIGAFPTNIPYSNFGTEVGAKNDANVNISYAYSRKESLDIEILRDFNNILDPSKTKYVQSATIDMNNDIINNTEVNSSLNPLEDGYQWLERGFYNSVQIYKEKNSSGRSVFKMKFGNR